MKIGIFTDTFYPEINGVATSCYNLARALEERGHEVHVFAPKCAGWESNNRPNYHFLDSIPFMLLKDRNLALPKIAPFREAMELKLDVVHTNSEFAMGIFGRMIAKHTKCARVHTYHTVWEDYTYYVTHGHGDDIAKFITRRYSKWWCKKFERIIVPTFKTKLLLLKYGIKNTIDIIPSGMAISHFKPENHSEEEKAEKRAELGIKENERVLLNIGRLAKEKNVVQLVRVFPKLLEEYPDVRLVIIGEGPMKEELENMVVSLGISDHVTIAGSKPWEEIDKYYAVGDVFVSASHSETQGLTYIEALASGICLCAVNDPCLDGVIENGVNGILTEDSDESLLNGLKMAFSPIGKEIGANAIESVNRYSSEHFASQIESAYEKAIASYEGENIEEDEDHVDELIEKHYLAEDIRNFFRKRRNRQ